MLDLKSLGIGFALAILLYFTLFINGLGNIGILGFFVAAVIGGYVVGGSSKTGAVHGALINLFGIIVVVVLLLVINSLYPNPTIKVTYNGIITIVSFVVGFLLYAFVGAIGGIIGAVIKNKLMERQ